MLQIKRYNGILILLILLFNLNTYGQKEENKDTTKNEIEIETVSFVEDFFPETPNCKGLTEYKLKKDCFSDQLYKIIYANLEYPDLARKHKIEGTVVIRVKIDKTNEWFSASRLKDLGGQTSKEALRVTILALNELLPHYEHYISSPHKPRERYVNSELILPIKFKL